MRLYIAGRITGLDPREANENFMRAETLIEKAGHTPLNPLTMVDQAEGRTYNEYLLDALKIMLTQAEGVYFLDNWRESCGAQIEYFTANMLKMPVYFAADELPVGSDWPEPRE